MREEITIKFRLINDDGPSTDIEITDKGMSLFSLFGTTHISYTSIEHRIDDFLTDPEIEFLHFSCNILGELTTPIIEANQLLEIFRKIEVKLLNNTINCLNIDLNKEHDFHNRTTTEIIDDYFNFHSSLIKSIGILEALASLSLKVRLVCIE